MFNTRSVWCVCVACFLISWNGSPVKGTNLNNSTRNINVCPGPLPANFTEGQHSADPSLRYIFAVFRHGIRSPLGDCHSVKPPPQRAVASPGRLTENGKKQMYDVGRVLRSRYNEFLGEYDEDLVAVTSTSSRRSLMSVLSVMAGLYPPSTIIFPNLKWQPIPIEQNTDDMDKTFIYRDKTFPKLGHAICPSLGKLLEVGRVLNNIPDVRPEYKQIYELLQQQTGDQTLNAISWVLVFADIIHSNCLDGISPPAWLLEPRTEFQNKALYPDLIIPLGSQWFKNCLFQNRSMLHYMTGPFFNAIHKTFEGALEANGLRRMTFHMSHDMATSPLVWALEPSEPVFCEPGDGLIFELHEKNNSTSVKVFYYDANHGHTLKELQLPGCPSPCSQQEFASKYQALTPKQWEDKCKS